MTPSNMTASARATIAPSPRVDAFLDTFAAGPGRSVGANRERAIDLTDAARRMDVRTTPFVYGVIDDFLPPDLYKAVLRDWPSEPELRYVPNAVPLPPVDPNEPRSNYLGNRTTRLLDEFDHGRITTSETDTWNRIAQGLRSPAFVRALFNRFPETVDENLAALEAVPSEPGFRLYACRDQGVSEALGAHLDAMRKVITIVLYVGLQGATNEDSPQAWGTALYDTAGEQVTPLHFMPNADYRLVDRVAFVPNRAWVMPNSRHALHGVCGGQPDVARTTLMCGYWYFTK